MATNKPEVKRLSPGYSVDSVMRGHLFMEECEHGAWVSLEDYEALQVECEKLHKDAETERQLQRAGQLLPEGWRIVVEIEKDSGWVDVYDPDYRRIEIDGGGILAEQIERAISAAMQEDA